MRINNFILGALAGAAFATPFLTKNARKLKIGEDKIKTLGLIGGTSWHSTVEYYRYLNTMTDQRVNSNPPLLMYSLNVELMRRGDWDEINRAYLDIARTLEDDGADAILICANTPHKVYDHVQPRLSIPILHIADATALEAERLGLTNLGLLGTKPVLGDGYIASRIESRFNIKVTVPGVGKHGTFHEAIAKKLTRGIFDDETKKLFRDEMDVLKRRGAEGIILGCTELPILFANEEYELPLLDTTKLHAQMAVDFILTDLNS